MFLVKCSTSGSDSCCRHREVATVMQSFDNILIRTVLHAPSKRKVGVVSYEIAAQLKNDAQNVK